MDSETTNPLRPSSDPEDNVDSSESGRGRVDGSMGAPRWRGSLTRARRRVLAPGLPEQASGRFLSFALTAVKIGPVLILILIAAAMTALEPIFFTERNIQNVLVQSSVIAAIGLGQLLVIVTRGIDLSVGSVVALSTVTGALVFETQFGGDLTVALTIALTGAAVGLVNGLVYVKGRLPHPFIVTLAMLSAASGLALVLSDGETKPGMPSLVRTLGSGFVGPVPVPALVVLALALLALLLVKRMVWGRWIYAIGGNPEAARVMGIPVDRVLVSVYVMCGLAAGMGGIITAGRTNSGFPTAGTGAELDSIAAVIIGGASFFGGRGSVGNVIVGALTIGVIRNGLNLLGVDPAWQLMAIGAIIVLAVQLDVLRTRVEARFRAAQGGERA